MQVGELAERVRLSHRTVRYYDDQGLLTSARSSGNYRLYTQADVERMLLIRRMKPLGYTLEQMRDVLTLLDALDATPRQDHPGTDHRDDRPEDPGAERTGERTVSAASGGTGAPNAEQLRLQDVIEDVRRRRDHLAEQLHSADDFLTSLQERTRHL